MQSTCQESLLAAQKFNYKWKRIWCILNTLKENRSGESDNGQSFQNKAKTIILFRARLPGEERSEKYWVLNAKPVAFWYTDVLSLCTYWIARNISLSVQGPQRSLLFKFWLGLTAKLKCSILFLTFSFWGGTLFEKAANPIPPLSGCQFAAVLQSVT